MKDYRIKENVAITCVEILQKLFPEKSCTYFFLARRKDFKCSCFPIKTNFFPQRLKDEHNGWKASWDSTFRKRNLKSIWKPIFMPYFTLFHIAPLKEKFTFSFFCNWFLLFLLFPLHFLIFLPFFIISSRKHYFLSLPHAWLYFPLVYT